MSPHERSLYTKKSRVEIEFYLQHNDARVTYTLCEPKGGKDFSARTWDNTWFIVVRVLRQRLVVNLPVLTAYFPVLA